MNLKKCLVVIMLLFVGQSFASVIDLSEGYNGESKRRYLRTVKESRGVKFQFKGYPQYVEKIIITAVGKQRAYSFGKVLVDGEEIATLGIPGRDPMYPIVVKERISTIEILATPGSKFKIKGFMIYTPNKPYSSYSDRRPRNCSVEDWGAEVLDIIYELDSLFGLSTIPNRAKFAALKRAAIRFTASERVRDERSLKTFQKVKRLIEVITQVEDLLLSNVPLLLSHRADIVITDLLTIKEDMLERYDLEL